VITAIDPGTRESAIVRFDGEKLELSVIVPNQELLRMARFGDLGPDIAVEMIACYGMPVGRETFETCLLIGRLQEIIEGMPGDCRLIFRKDVKMHLCQSMRAKDANIRQALIDKHGEPGTKGNPGKLYGIKSHLWSALAVADYALCNPGKEAPRG
jgi:hypothetical protein